MKFRWRYDREPCFTLELIQMCVEYGWPCGTPFNWRVVFKFIIMHICIIDVAYYLWVAIIWAAGSMTVCLKTKKQCLLFGLSSYVGIYCDLQSLKESLRHLAYKLLASDVAPIFLRWNRNLLPLIKAVPPEKGNLDQRGDTVAARSCLCSANWILPNAIKRTELSTKLCLMPKHAYFTLLKLLPITWRGLFAGIVGVERSAEGQENRLLNETNVGAVIL